MANRHLNELGEKTNIKIVSCRSQNAVERLAEMIPIELDTGNAETRNGISY